MERGRELNLTLDFCLRVGEVLLASGAGAADVTSTMLALARAFGFRHVDVDVTFTSLSMSHQARPDQAPVVANRIVQARVIDYQDLTHVDHLVRAVLRGDRDLAAARSDLLSIMSTGHDRPRWAVTAGWGCMCAGIAVMLGGGPVVVLLALVAAAVIDRLQLRLSRRRLPNFYLQIAGGAVATLIAVAAQATSLVEVDVSQVITANIVMLLAGIGFMGALQDALTGFYITAGARLIEALLATAGIIAGVTGGIDLAAALGLDIPALDPGASSMQDLGGTAIGAAVAAAAFAFASYSPRRVLLPVAAVAAGAALVSRSVSAPGIGGTWAVAFAALFVGLLGYGVSSRLRVPPLVLVVSAVVPLLPGLSIYRGLSLLAEGSRRNASEGLLALMTAAAVAIALSAGVILGQYVAQPLGREARRLEGRLSGPRLVGPVRTRRLVRQRRRRNQQGRPVKRVRSEDAF